MRMRFKIHIKKTLLLLTILIVGVAAYGQSKYEADKLLKTGSYEAAYQIYKPLADSDTLDSELNYKTGICLLNFSTNRHHALPYLKRVNPNSKILMDNDLFYHLAKAYFYSEQFDSALVYLDRYKTTSRQQYADSIQIVHNWAQNGNMLIAQKLKVKFINLGANINSEYNEQTPFITSNDEFLVYSSLRADGLSEIYESRKIWDWDNSWQVSSPLTSDLKAAYNAYVSYLKPDGTMIFVHYSEDSPLRDVDYAIKNTSGYSELENYGEPINYVESCEQGACISDDENLLFFASDMKGGYGGFDIYMCVKLPNGNWGKPVNLGPTINTEFDENYPVFTNKLIFCSQGHTSMGGFDLFISQMIEDEFNKWTEPQNFGYPINNTYDNKTISMLSNDIGYISTYREDSYGENDIYKIVIENRITPRMVYKGSIITGIGSEKTEIHNVDRDITITARNMETGKLFGIYSLNKGGSNYLISFIPGSYEVIIEGPSYEEYREIFIIPHSVPPEGDNVTPHDIYLTLKNKR